MPPRISVIIPTYNRARDLERALASVLVQTFSDLEVLVIDNHSTDDTASVIARLADPRVSLHSIDNQGIVAKSRNLGIHLARGEFVAFLDSDDWWAPGKLRASLTGLEGGADVVFHHLYLVRRPRQKVYLRKVRARSLRSPVFHDLLINGVALPQSSVVMRRSLLLEIGGMPEDREFVAMEDYVCWLRAARRTERFLRIRGTFGYYWACGGNLSSDARTIAILDRVLSEYSGQLTACGLTSMPAWIAYAYARAHYRMGSLARARVYLAMINRNTAPFSIAAKASFTRAELALANWRRLRSGIGGGAGGEPT